MQWQVQIIQAIHQVSGHPSNSSSIRSMSNMQFIYDSSSIRSFKHHFQMQWHYVNSILDHHIALCQHHSFTQIKMHIDLNISTQKNMNTSNINSQLDHNPNTWFVQPVIHWSSKYMLMHNKEEQAMPYILIQHTF